VATRILSRRALRDQNDAVEPTDADEASDEGDAAPKARKPRARKAPAGEKKPAKPRARKKAVKVSPVMFARWAVFDNGMKRVAVFEYKDRAGADTKLAEVRAKKPGTYFVLLVKDPVDPPAAPA
jgi:hypothetical protein